MTSDAEAMRLILAELLKPQFSSDAIDAIRGIVASTGRDVRMYPIRGGCRA